MQRNYNTRYLRHHSILDEFGLTVEMIGGAINYVHSVLDGIDMQLLDAGSERLSELVELANLSAIIGNLYRGGIVRAFNKKFVANSPHKYPDLLGLGIGCRDIEIKVALEGNKPKGHLIKPGPHLTLRYVLGEASGQYKRSQLERGNVSWIWEIRVGELREEHFSFSNTEGDSGKTAVINASGMRALTIIYCDLDRSPLSPKGSAFREVSAIYRTE